MNRFVRIIIVGILLSVAGMLPVGCVTAHEAHVKLDVLDTATHHDIDDCLLLSIRLESTESQGRWWVAQDEEGSHMVPKDVLLTTVNSGEFLHQPGKVVMTIGPYVRGRTVGVEYWLFRPGYQPDDFLSDHVERSYENKTPLNITLLREDSGSTISDEQILDAARRVLEIAEFLDPENPDATRLFTLLIEQVQRVKKNSYKPKWQRQSRELLPELQKELQRFPRVAVVWKNAPKAPIEPPMDEPTLASASPATQPALPPEMPLGPVAESTEDVPAETEEPVETADLPTAETQPVEDEEPPSPELVPVDLSDLGAPATAETQPADIPDTPKTQPADTPNTAETQPEDVPDAAETQPTNTPAEDAQDDTIQNDLTPIHK